MCATLLITSRFVRRCSARAGRSRARHFACVARDIIVTRVALLAGTVARNIASLELHGRTVAGFQIILGLNALVALRTIAQGRSLRTRAETFSLTLCFRLGRRITCEGS